MSRDGYKALPFNGQMDADNKIANQEAFMTDQVRIIVATSAFGMGVDKKDVGLVIHYEISDSLENYVDMIDAQMKESIEAHKISDVEVGSFLSSGVDSSYVVKEMSKNNNVRTFSVGYEEEKYSELKYAQAFAETAGVDNYIKKISAEEPSQAQNSYLSL